MNNENREQQMMAAADAYAAEIYKDEPDNFHTDEQLCETINDFCAGWRAADQHPHWIPVEERLPEERKVVWVRKHFNKEVLGEFDIYDSAAFCNGEFQCDNSPAVTHWMPIVPPRKEVEK